MKKQTLSYSTATPLPNNFLAEESVLNILLTTPKLIKKSIASLKSESFYYEPHKIIYETLLKLENQNKNINLTILITKLQDDALLKNIGGIQRIVEILQRFENSLDLDEYIRDINQKYLRRLIINFGKESILLGYKTSIETDEILTKIERSLFNLNQQNLSQKTYSIAEVIDDIFLELTSKIKNNSETGLNSSFSDLDALLQGFQKSDLIIVAGRPSMGKTAFALNVGRNIVNKYKIPLIIFTLEMSRQQIIYRFLSTHSNINYTRLKSGKMTKEEWNILSKSMREMADLPIFIDDNPNLTINDIRSRLRTIFSTKKKEGLIIIDYLQLMKNNLFQENRAQEIAYITRNLKILAKEFELPIILLSQLSRNVESRPNKRPLLSDLRESGSIEQDADLVIMLYREDYYTETQKKSDSMTEFIIAKHRNGPVGTVRLNFHFTTASFRNI